jgi:CHASE3 domain sensor protein
MKRLISNNVIVASIILVVVLICLSTGLVIYNRKVVMQATEVKDRSELTLLRSDAILNNLQAIDLGLRGYAITKDKTHFGHYQSALQGTQATFDSLEFLLNKQHYDLTEFRLLRSEMNKYADFCKQVVAAIEVDSVQQYSAMISQDKGFDTWKAYQNFYQKLTAYEAELNQQAQLDFYAASSDSVWAMIALLLISVPTMGFVVYKLQQSKKNRKDLFIELEQNNRKYNFDPGTPILIRNEYELVESYINNSKKAAEFINHVANGEYNVDWEGLHDDIRARNQDNLAGALVKMRDQMKRVQLEEEKRKWSSDGIARFSELIRNYQQDLATLSNQALIFLVKYLQAQQGSLFIVREEGEQTYLDMAACYAFNRKKYLNKRVEIGQGMVGQAYLEAQTILLTEIPGNYTSITSGLGDATPRCLLIVPMMYNEKVQAVIEFASFVKYEPYQVEFIEKIGEFVASTISSVMTNEKTKELLEQFKAQTEQLRAQEEELRQNMEELEATQEDMRRNNQELETKLSTTE